MKNSSFFFCFWVMVLPKIVYRQGFMLLFLSNGNSNETGAFSPFLQKCQRSSIYGAFRTFYILQVLNIAHFLKKYFPLSSYMFSYLSKSFNRSKSRRTLIALLGFKSQILRHKKPSPIRVVAFYRGFVAKAQLCSSATNWVHKQALRRKRLALLSRAKFFFKEKASQILRQKKIPFTK